MPMGILNGCFYLLSALCFNSTKGFFQFSEQLKKLKQFDELLYKKLHFLYPYSGMKELFVIWRQKQIESK